MMNDRRPQLAFALFTVGAALGLGLARPAVAQPSMTVDSHTYIGDEDPDHPGVELVVLYDIHNTSESEPLGMNNMLSFTFSAGSQQGVTWVVCDGPMSSWTAEIGETSSYLSCNGHPLRAGDWGRVWIISTLLHVGQGEATAVAAWPPWPPWNQFNPVLVPVPAYHPLDREHDVDIDGDDLLAFEACASGPAIVFPGGCGWADLDDDTDVDQIDFGIFQRCLTSDGGGYIEDCETS